MIRKKISNWNLNYKEYSLPCTVPCSLYSVLLDNKIIEDPYYRMNEKKATVLSEENCTMVSVFDITEEMLQKKHVSLNFLGIDTLCNVYFNGKHLFYAENMHRTWQYDVKSIAKCGKNELKLCFSSPSEYITQKNSEHYLYTATAGGSVMEGIGHIRKAHYMFGWDWGPQLPDMGIYRDAFIEAYDARIDDVEIRQHHENGKVKLLLSVYLDDASADMYASAKITHPCGKTQDFNITLGKQTELEIEDPELWWPNGLGTQPLYTLDITLESHEKTEDTVCKTIGLRTLTVSTEKDEYGEEFCFTVNGKKFFSMGADYVPEENILPRRSKERTEKLIRTCADANFNSIRVWGGGYYPDNYFYELCDKYGIVVWQDFMFACMNVLMTEKFEKNVRAEFRDVLKRIRHHACLGLLCGNNEMELALIEWSTCLRSKTQKVVDDYLLLYENVIPEMCKKYAPDIFYWPASPSSHGGFDDPNNENIGDTHYWKVWHGGVPFEEYRKHYFRYCSEFGFESFPSMKTLESFALPEDMSIDSDVMHSHQKCLSGNEKIMSYVREYYKIPQNFAHFVYLSQIIQADAIRYGVEHFRRHRGRCMGALYWQLNDCWPVVSWASVDYFGRWKALHYRAKKFFTPTLISVHEDGDKKIINISNETLADFCGIVTATLKNNKFETIESFSCSVSLPELSAVDITLPESLYKKSEANKSEFFLEYKLESDGIAIAQDSKIYVKPFEYKFESPEISASIKEDNGEYFLDITAKRYAKNVMLEWKNADVTPDDNFFDITNEKTSVKLIGTKEAIFSEMPQIISVYDIQQ